MRVICTRIINPVTGSDEPTSPWLALDAEYEVLEIWATPGRGVKLRLASNDAGTPALFDAAMFLAADSSVPSGWIVSLFEGGELRIGPREWMREGFWEDFFDLDPEAVRAYDRGALRQNEGGEWAG